VITEFLFEQKKVSCEVVVNTRKQTIARQNCNAEVRIKSSFAAKFYIKVSEVKFNAYKGVHYSKNLECVNIDINTLNLILVR
jgi:hypothetical protein